MDNKKDLSAAPAGGVNPNDLPVISGELSRVVDSIDVLLYEMSNWYDEKTDSAHYITAHRWASVLSLLQERVMHAYTELERLTEAAEDAAEDAAEAASQGSPETK